MLTGTDNARADGAPSSTRALTIRAHDGQAWTEATPDILDAGVDTVEFSFDVEVSQAMWDALENERQIAEELMKERRAVHVPEWLNAQLSPTGAQGGYRFLLETPHFAVKLLRGVPNRPPIYVEMRAFGLHTHAGGALAACEEACAFIRDTLLADQDQAWAEHAVNLDTARCSRIDPFIDWQGGWMPTFESGDERCFVKRVHATADRFSCDGAVTGYAIGKGSIRGRLYDKSLQTKKKHVEWYAELLTQRAGTRYDPERPVWRLEFQLRREGVKGFKLVRRPRMDDGDDVIDAELAAEEVPSISSVRDAFVWLGHLWRYLTTRWLRLVIPSGDPNRARWPEHPTWAALREGFAPLAMVGAPLLPEQVELVRAKRYTGYQRLLDRMAAGVTTTLEAMDTDPGAALSAYLAYCCRIAGRVRRMQKRRAKAWRTAQAEASTRGRPLSIAPDLSRGMGARRDGSSREEKREQLLQMALGVFDGSGVVRLRLHREADVSNVGDLLLYSLDELEAVAREKGGIRQLLDEKWRAVYKANAPRGMFTVGEMRSAA